MKITIESPGIRISEKLQKDIHTKFTRLEKFCDRVVNCDVVLKKENDSKGRHFSIEARLQVPKELLFATEKAETFEIALNKLIEDMEQQLRRLKESWVEVR